MAADGLVREMVGNCDVDGDLAGKRGLWRTGDDDEGIEATEERERIWPRARPEGGREDDGCCWEQLAA